MSVKVLDAVFNLPARVSATDRLILLALADEANDEGRVHKLSMRRLARKVGASQRTARRRLHGWKVKDGAFVGGLVGAGYVRVIPRTTEKGGHASNGYLIDLDALRAISIGQSDSTLPDKAASDTPRTEPCPMHSVVPKPSVPTPDTPTAKSKPRDLRTCEVSGVEIPAALLERLDGEDGERGFAVGESGVNDRGRGNGTDRFMGYVADALKASGQNGRFVVAQALDGAARNVARCRGNVIDYFAGVLLRVAARAGHAPLLQWIAEDARGRGWNKTGTKANRALGRISIQSAAESAKAPRVMSECELVAQRQRYHGLIADEQKRHDRLRDAGQRRESQQRITDLRDKLALLTIPGTWPMEQEAPA